MWEEIPMIERNQRSLAGMTVNERLSHVGTMARWREAAQRRDRETMIALLEQVEVPDPHLVVDAMLADPKKFGF
jgi:hypothetical protein